MAGLSPWHDFMQQKKGRHIHSCTGTNMPFLFTVSICWWSCHLRPFPYYFHWVINYLCDLFDRKPHLIQLLRTFLGFF